jgi:hypothetical protein
MRTGERNARTGRAPPAAAAAAARAPWWVGGRLPRGRAGAHRTRSARTDARAQQVGEVGNFLACGRAPTQHAQHAQHAQQGAITRAITGAITCARHQVGEVGNFLAYGWAPTTLVAPLGAVSVISNCVLVPLPSFTPLVFDHCLTAV